MDKNAFIAVIKKAREGKKRNFSQSFDLIVNFKDLDLKKPEHQFDIYFRLPKPTAKQKKVCAFVDADMVDEAKATCDGFVRLDEFEKYAKDKKSVKKLANSYDFFIAQATLMPKVASTFGRVLGPKGRMPNPKSGAIFPPKAALKPIVEKFRNTVRVRLLKAPPLVQALIGTEQMSDDAIAENAASLFEQITHALPAEVGNVRSAYIKMTMGSAVKVR